LLERSQFLAVRTVFLRSRHVSAEESGMDGNDLPIVRPVHLRCVECDAISAAEARGWRTYLAPDPDEPQGELMLATYCRECAEREFGPVVREQQRSA
jgi:hypothetical protein